MCGPQGTKRQGVTTGVGNSRGKGLEEKWFPIPGGNRHTGEVAFDKPRDKPRRDPRSDHPLPHSPRLPKITTGREGCCQQPSKEAGLAILGRNGHCRGTVFRLPTVEERKLQWTFSPHTVNIHTQIRRAGFATSSSP